MIKTLEGDKPYLVNGRLILLIFQLKELYEMPAMINNKLQPFQSEKISYIVGKLACEIERMQWEEALNEVVNERRNYKY